MNSVLKRKLLDTIFFTEIIWVWSSGRKTAFKFKYSPLLYYTSIKPALNIMNLPNLSRPIKNSTIPEIKVRNSTNAGVNSLVYSNVSKDNKDVGPIETSFIVPNIA